MEVTHLSDLDTHAIIGGGPTEKFQMAQTGHFFEILSKTLYANGRLAVIREVLCNAWDSHIASGVMGTSVLVLLDANELIIRDYGAGIPHHLIHTIYCVYGNSTKTNDGNQTGGFGLGSKAPFAYSDHFTVTNHHKGTKVVHAISKGSTNSDGTPERRVVVEVPTIEQGVEVRIPIKNSQDVRIFQQYIEKITKYGEMNVTLNGNKLPRWDLSTSPEGFVVDQQDNFGIESQSQVYIRYGNVVYPVERNNEYASEMAAVYEFLEKLPGTRGWGGHKWNICFQAAPNTITVTPSRESIQLTETTIKTLKDLFAKVSNKVKDADLYDLREEIVEKATLHYVKQNPLFLLKFLDGESPFIKGTDVDSRGYQKPIKSILDAKQRIIRDNFRYSDSDRLRRLKLLAESNPPNKRTIQALMKRLEKKDTKGKHIAVWQSEEILGLMKSVRTALRKKVKNDPRVSDGNFGFLTEPSSGVLSYDIDSSEKYNPYDSKTAMAFIKNRVVVAYSKKSISDHLGSMTYGDKDIGIMMGVPVFIVPRKKDAYKNALEFFREIKWEVLDVEDYIDANNLRVVRIPSATPAAPKILGIPRVSCLKDPRTGIFNLRAHLENDTLVNKNRIEKPEWVITAEAIGKREYERKFFKCKLDKVGLTIVELFGDTGGIAVNSRQQAKYIADGAKEAYQYFSEKLLEEFETNTTLIDYFGGFHLAYPRTTAQVKLAKLWRIGEKVPSIKKLMKYPRQLTDQELKWVSFFGKLDTDNPSNTLGDYYYIPEGMVKACAKIKTLIRMVPDAPQYLEMIKMTDSKMFRYVDLEEILHIFEDKTATQQEKDDAEGILFLALEG